MLEGRLRLLSSSQMQQIDSAVMSLLKKTGCRVDNERLRTLLGRSGARVDETTRVVRFPERMVEELIARQRQRASTQSPRPRECRSALGGVYLYTYDWRAGERRQPTTADILEVLHGGDSLPEVATVGGLINNEIDPRFEAVETMALILGHTRKPAAMEPVDPRHIQYLARLGGIYCGKELDPRFVVSCHSMITPLVMDDRAACYMMGCAKYGCPMSTVSQPVSGLSSPVTMAGTVALACAEILGVWLIVQAVAPDATPTAGVASGSLDMRTTEVSFASPEALLQDAAVVQMFDKLYGGTVDSATDWTDAKVPGLQAAFEKTFKKLTAGMGAGHRIGLAAGLLDAGATFSSTQAMLDLEVNAALWRYQQGLEVSREAIALELIEEVGIGGSFLASEHTLRHFREAWYPRLLDRSVWSELAPRAASEQEVLTRADERWRAAVAAYEPLALPPDQATEIEGLLAHMRKALA